MAGKQHILRYGVDISNFHVKGVYCCSFGRHRKQTGLEMICTVREGRDDVVDFPCQDLASTPDSQLAKRGITITIGGASTTFRPWDPASCFIAAGLLNRLIHFPIKHNSGILALGCSLETLSHIADIVGLTGTVIGVFDPTHSEMPSSQDLRRFFKHYPNVWILVHDIATATAETYETALGIPKNSKYAFLMGLHDRLGAESPVQKLLEAEDPSAIASRIFGFLESPFPDDIRCYVVSHWPAGSRVEVIRSYVINHIHIFQPRQKMTEEKKGESREANDESDSNDDVEDSKTDGKVTTSATDALGEPVYKKKEKAETPPSWVFMVIPLDNLVSRSTNASVTDALLEVVDDMKRIRSGLRTGLLAKEQLMLSPYLPNRTLLLLKYVAHRDECKNSLQKGLHGSSRERGGKPPGSSSVPFPSFSKFGSSASSSLGGHPLPPSASSCAGPSSSSKHQAAAVNGPPHEHVPVAESSASRRLHGGGSDARPDDSFNMPPGLSQPPPRRGVLTSPGSGPGAGPGSSSSSMQDSRGSNQLHIRQLHQPELGGSGQVVPLSSMNRNVLDLGRVGPQGTQHQMILGGVGGQGGPGPVTPGLVDQYGQGVGSIGLVGIPPSSSQPTHGQHGGYQLEANGFWSPPQQAKNPPPGFWNGDDSSFQGQNWKGGCGGGGAGQKFVPRGKGSGGAGPQLSGQGNTKGFNAGRGKGKGKGTYGEPINVWRQGGGRSGGSVGMWDEPLDGASGGNAWHGKLASF